MKKLRLLWAYSQGVRLAALILVGISCYALYTAVDVTRYLKYTYDNYAFIRDTDLHGAYSFVPWYSPRSDEEWEQYDGFFLLGGDTKMLRAMAEHPAVEALGLRGFYENPLYLRKEEESADPRGSSGVFVQTLSPEMFSFFPNLKKLFPFDDPRGVYLIGDDLFPFVKTGDTLRLYSPEASKQETVKAPPYNQIETVSYKAFTVDLQVEGRYALPFCMPQMMPGGSGASEESIADWEESPFLLMLDTEENREWLTSLGFRGPDYMFEFYIRYNEQATKEKIAEVKSMITRFGGLTSLGEVQEELEGTLKTKFLNTLPDTILRMSILLLCYVSLILLTVSKKRKEIAVSYLCGGTKEKNAGLLTAFLFFVTVPAGILSLVYLYLVPSYAWERVSQEHFRPSLMHFSKEIVPVSVVLLYFALMLLLGWILVKASMGRRSPVEYFKEATN